MSEYQIFSSDCDTTPTDPSLLTLGNSLSLKTKAGLHPLGALSLPFRLHLEQDAAFWPQYWAWLPISVYPPEHQGLKLPSWNLLGSPSQMSGRSSSSVNTLSQGFSWLTSLDVCNGQLLDFSCPVNPNKPSCCLPLLSPCGARLCLTIHICLPSYCLAHLLWRRRKQAAIV